MIDLGAAPQDAVLKGVGVLAQVMHEADVGGELGHPERLGKARGHLGHLAKVGLERFEPAVFRGVRHIARNALSGAHVILLARRAGLQRRGESSTAELALISLRRNGSNELSKPHVVALVALSGKLHLIGRSNIIIP